MDIVEDYVCDQDYRLHVPDGIYEAECFDCHPGFYAGVPKLFLRFRLLNVSDKNDPNKNVELFMAFNMPYDGRIPVGSKYYKTWTKVNGRLPSRNARMAARLFMNKLYKVKTRTVKPTDGGEELPQHFHYSIVDSILEVMF